jgi:methionine-rich copper-binding protein CopC
MVLAAVVAVAGAFAARAWAHAFPSGEEPKVGSTVNTPPTEVVIKFDNPIEQLFAQLKVTDDTGDDVTAGPPVRSADKLELKVPLKPLKPGDYHVKWRVVAEDGHGTEGGYLFTVAGGS